MIQPVVNCFYNNFYKNKIFDRICVIVSLSFIFGIIFFAFNRNFYYSIVFSLLGIPALLILRQQILRIAFFVPNKFNLYKFIWRLIMFLLANTWLFLFVNVIFDFIPNNFMSYFLDYDINYDYSNYFQQLFLSSFIMFMITSSVGLFLRIIDAILLKEKTRMIK